MRTPIVRRLAAILLTVSSTLGLSAPPVAAQANCPTITQKYDELGGEKSVLGRPSAREENTKDRTGRYRHYQFGTIFWSAQPCAQEVHGSIREKYKALGWERPNPKRGWWLGYPITDELPTPDGIGRFNHFQGGSIYFHPDTGVHEIHGAIRDKWASMDWERSFLGYPLSDERPMDDGQGAVQDFQGGRIYWHPATSAVAVTTAQLTAPRGEGQAQRVPGAPAVTQRRITWSGSWDIEDYEVWTDNERGKPKIDNRSAVVRSDHLVVVGEAEACVGDEVRGELFVEGVLLGDGSVLIRGTVQMYEGVDCATNELEGEKTFEFLVPPGQTEGSGKITVRTSGMLTGDCVAIELFAHNAS
jgi:uncharacterized protein with LGFP repeats